MINRCRKLFRKNRIGMLLLLLAVPAVLSGCNKDTMSEGKAQKGYTLPEIMIIATAEKNRYEAVCTDQIWGVSISGESGDFETYLTDQIQSFMEEMKIMNLLAEKKKISLTSEERATMTEAGDEYYSSLTETDISHMNVTREEVQNVYEDYYLANKLVEELTKTSNLEVSDSEAKVISIMEAKTDDKETADRLYQTASQENADFQKCAEDLGITVTTRPLGREETGKEFETAAFALTTNQVSGVITDRGSYYVLRCLSDYDEAATAERKEIIFKERKRKAFREIYDDFKAGVSLTYSGDPWEKLNLKDGKYAQNADFFGIYKKYANPS